MGADCLRSCQSDPSLEETEPECRARVMRLAGIQDQDVTREVQKLRATAAAGQLVDGNREI